MSYVLLDKTELIPSAQHTVFRDLMNSRKYSSFFDNTFLKTRDNYDESIPKHFKFVATISEYREYLYICGTINSVKKDESFPELNFEWILKPSKKK